MADTLAPVRLTYEDYLTIPPDGQRHEIIDGDEYMSPAPLLHHQRIVTRLGRILGAYAEAHDLGEVFVAPTDVRLEDGVVQPDVLFVRAERSYLLEREAVVGAPDLVAEVLSEATRRHDEGRKLRLYERVGVAEVWIADPESEVLRLYRLGAGGLYGRPDERSAARGDTAETPLLPGLVVHPAEVFAR